MLGITRAEGTAKVSGHSNSDDETDLSYGIGIDFNVSNHIYIGLEYMSYLSKSDFDLNSIALGVTKYF